MNYEQSGAHLFAPLAMLGRASGLGWPRRSVERS